MTTTTICRAPLSIAATIRMFSGPSAGKRPITITPDHRYQARKFHSTNPKTSSNTGSGSGVNSDGASIEPPPAGGHLPSVSTSSYLRTTREKALRTPGLRWADEDDTGPEREIISGRDARKMNLYQAVRDAMRYACVWNAIWL